MGAFPHAIRRILEAGDGSSHLDESILVDHCLQLKPFLDSLEQAVGQHNEVEGLIYRHLHPSSLEYQGLATLAARVTDLNLVSGFRLLRLLSVQNTYEASLEAKAGILQGAAMLLSYFRSGKLPPGHSRRPLAQGATDPRHGQQLIAEVLDFVRLDGICDVCDLVDCFVTDMLDWKGPGGADEGAGLPPRSPQDLIQSVTLLTRVTGMLPSLLAALDPPIWGRGDGSQALSSVRAGPAVYRCCDDALGAWFDEYDSHLMPAFSRFFELDCYATRQAAQLLDQAEGGSRAARARAADAYLAISREVMTAITSYGGERLADIVRTAVSHLLRCSERALRAAKQPKRHLLRVGSVFKFVGNCLRRVGVMAQYLHPHVEGLLAEVQAAIENLQRVEQRHGIATGPTQNGLIQAIGGRLQRMGALTPGQAAVMTYVASEEYRACEFCGCWVGASPAYQPSVASRSSASSGDGAVPASGTGNSSTPLGGASNQEAGHLLDMGKVVPGQYPPLPCRQGCVTIAVPSRSHSSDDSATSSSGTAQQYLVYCSAQCVLRDIQRQEEVTAVLSAQFGQVPPQGPTLKQLAAQQQVLQQHQQQRQGSSQPVSPAAAPGSLETSSLDTSLARLNLAGGSSGSSSGGGRVVGGINSGFASRGGQGSTADTGGGPAYVSTAVLTAVGSPLLWDETTAPAPPVTGRGVVAGGGGGVTSGAAGRRRMASHATTPGLAGATGVANAVGLGAAPVQPPIHSSPTRGLPVYRQALSGGGTTPPLQQQQQQQQQGGHSPVAAGKPGG